MAQEQLNSRPDFGKTFTAAIWLLGMIAAAQVLAVGWAVLTRPVVAGPEPVSPASSHAGEPAVFPGGGALVSLPPPSGGGLPAPSSSVILPVGEGQPPVLAPGGLPPMPILPDVDSAPPPSSARNRILTGPAPPVLSDALLPGSRFTGPESPPPLSTTLSEAALLNPPAQAIPDPEVGRLVDSGAEQRASGNMRGALDALRKAEAVLPDHPRILAEIAATYGEMGLDRKASLYWEQVRDLGAEAAGPWHAIAGGQLAGPSARPPAKAPPVLRLGQVNAAHDQTVTEGERVVLSATVEADPKARPSPAQMEMRVYFYQLADGDTIVASTTAKTSQNFISAPYDWLGEGTETIEIIYQQPEFSQEQKRELGERAYYGYIIELYYRGQLQDSAAFPPDLRDLNPRTRPSPLTQESAGPENSLFPSDNE